MEQKFSIRNFQKFGYSSRGCPLFWRVCKILFYSPLEISGNATGIFGRMTSALCVLTMRPANQPVLLQNGRDKTSTTTDTISYSAERSVQRRLIKVSNHAQYQFIGRSLLTSLFTFFLISIRLCTEKASC